MARRPASIEDEITMSTTGEPPPKAKTTRIYVEQSFKDVIIMDDESNNKPLIIVLAVTLPTLALIGILILLLICYRRRHATIWLKKIEHSNQLQAIVVNLSSPTLQTEYPEKKTHVSHRQLIQPRTETIVYNRLSTPSTPVFVNPFNHVRSSTEGETNAAFDACLIKNELQPVLRSTAQQSSGIGQHKTTLDGDFPVSLQAPVRTITSALVEAIAAHRLSLVVDSSSDTTTTSNRLSGASSSYSTTSQTVLLFSQRTEL